MGTMFGLSMGPRSVLAGRVFFFTELAQLLFELTTNGVLNRSSTWTGLEPVLIPEAAATSGQLLLMEWGPRVVLAAVLIASLRAQWIAPVISAAAFCLAVFSAAAQGGGYGVSLLLGYLVLVVALATVARVMLVLLRWFYWPMVLISLRWFRRRLLA